MLFNLGLINKVSNCTVKILFYYSLFYAKPLFIGTRYIRLSKVVNNKIAPDYCYTYLNQPLDFNMNPYLKTIFS